MRQSTRSAGWAMVLFLATSLVVSLLTIPGPGLQANETKADDDLKKLQGTWVSAGDDAADLRWVIDKDILKASVNGQEYTCKITLDPKAMPHPTADLAISDGPGDSAGKVSRAIYKFEGEMLFFCVTQPGDENRPTEFKAIEGEAFLFKMKKAR